MKKIVGFGLAAAFTVSAFGGAAFAASDNQATPGTPGTKNCAGQTTAYLAQGNLTGAHGIGNVSDVTGLSVQQIKALIDTYCA